MGMMHFIQTLTGECLNYYTSVHNITVSPSTCLSRIRCYLFESYVEHEQADRHELTDDELERLLRIFVLGHCDK